MESNANKCFITILKQISKFNEGPLKSDAGRGVRGLMQRNTDIFGTWQWQQLELINFAVCV